MQQLGLNEIRERFLSFFESKEHLRLESFPLVPQNDKSLLLINSGMAPLKPYFTGQEVPPKKRVTTCQKCIRTGDIENVGKTARHGTFFEMLGNFSFGDYFKEEIIAWAWEFVTEVMGIEKDRLYISVYEEDDEAFEIWNKKMGIPTEKLVRMGKDDNFWEVGLGPCGPCSEIYYDRGLEFGCGKDDCAVGCDCDRFMEFWNLVFTQFNKEEDGSYSKLANPNIDTGMGLERMAAMMQGVDSIFDVDTIKAIRDAVCKLANVAYKQDGKKDVSIRVITDHVRSVTFMTADGVLPSNEGRGYVLRRLLRRAARHGKLLGIKDMFLTELSKIVIDVSKDAYPALSEKKDYIFKVLSVEEQRFYETLDQGMDILKDYIAKAKSRNEKVMNGVDSFKLYDTYGFPLELMKEILEEEGLSIHEHLFNEEMQKQKERARAAREETNYMGADETVYHKLDTSLVTKFIGYSDYVCENAKIVAITRGNDIVNSAKTGDEVSVFVDVTPFYAESGGQKGDIGVIETKSGKVIVRDCMKVMGNKFAHIGVVEGEINISESAKLSIDMERRLATARNHTATHLLQKALREVLGSHVEQAGSYVSGERLRFDFTHFTSMTNEELMEVEKKVNEKILDGFDVTISEESIEDARKMGATALFGEKYGDRVRVVNVSQYSIELCGGTHIQNTALIGSFKLISESGVAAGVRRIEALTGKVAYNYYREQNEFIKNISGLLKTTPDLLLKKVEAIVNETRELTKEVSKLKSKMSGNVVEDILASKETVHDMEVILSRVDDLDMNGLRTMCDQLRDKLKAGVIVLASSADDKVNLIVSVSDDLIKKGVHAGNIIKEVAAVVGGGGGGRPNMAQAGGKDPSKIQDAFKKAREILGAL